VSDANVLAIELPVTIIYPEPNPVNEDQPLFGVPVPERSDFLCLLFDAQPQISLRFAGDEST
jgi:hypothetical protein